jgi:hypothetical protein
MPIWNVRGRRMHTITADISGTWRLVLTITVDGEIVHESDRAVLPQMLVGDHRFRAGPHQGVLRVRRNWFTQEWQYELELAGQLIPIDEPTALARTPSPSRPQPEARTEEPSPLPQTAPADAALTPAAPGEPSPIPPSATSQPVATTPVVPVLPLRCAGCGTQLTMSNVEWTGPMSARCPSCGSGVDIRWQKVGE